MRRALLVATIVLSGACGDAGLCENSSQVEIPSPDGKLEAWVYIRVCGATTASSVHVSILPAGSSAPDGRGNTFIAAQAGSVAVDWPSERELRVFHESIGEVFKQQREVAGVSVSYERE